MTLKQKAKATKTMTNSLVSHLTRERLTAFLEAIKAYQGSTFELSQNDQGDCSDCDDRDFLNRITVSLTGRAYQIGKKLGNGSYSNVYALKADGDECYSYALKHYTKQYEESEDEGECEEDSECDEDEEDDEDEGSDEDEEGSPAHSSERVDEQTVDMDVGALRELSILVGLLKDEGDTYGDYDICEIVDIVYHIDNLGIVMKKYKATLASIMDDGDLTHANKCFIAQRLLRSLSYLHAKDILHRDIKPENIMMEVNQGSGIGDMSSVYSPIVVDFTLGKNIHALNLEGTHTTHVATSYYRAPEIIAKKRYSKPSDVWALGVVLLEMFTERSITECETDEESLEVVLRRVKRLKSSDSKGLDWVRLVKEMLVVDTQKRGTFEGLLLEHFGEKIEVSERGEKVEKIKVSPGIEAICKRLGAKKKVTRSAAQRYTSLTGCNKFAAVHLAMKIYESELLGNPYVDDEVMVTVRMLEYGGLYV
jgi:serine/threonine protein kinase